MQRNRIRTKAPDAKCWNKIKLVQGESMVEVVILVVERLIEEDDENREIRKIEMRILNGII